MIQLGTSPAVGRLAVPEELPTIRGFTRGDGIGNGVYLGNVGIVRSSVLLDILGEDTDIPP